MAHDLTDIVRIDEMRFVGAEKSKRSQYGFIRPQDLGHDDRSLTCCINNGIITDGFDPDDLAGRDQMLSSFIREGNAM